MTFMGLNNLIEAWNKAVLNAVPPVVHMHPKTVEQYIEWYNNNNDIKLEYPPKFKGVKVEANSSLEPQIALVIRRDGWTQRIAVEFK